MARRYNPEAPFDVAFKVLKPTSDVIKGVTKKVFPDPEKEDDVYFGSFRTFGGTENFSNDIYTIFNTATIDTWFNPEITADCEIYICKTREVYQIISEPENIGMRDQYMQFKVEKIGGKA